MLLDSLSNDIILIFHFKNNSADILESLPWESAILKLSQTEPTSWLLFGHRIQPMTKAQICFWLGLPRRTLCNTRKITRAVNWTKIASTNSCSNSVKENGRESVDLWIECTRQRRVHCVHESTLESLFSDLNYFPLMVM